MKYRKKSEFVEAMQLPNDYDDEKKREIAIWMAKNGYDGNPDDDDITGWHENYVYRDDNGRLYALPEYGTNYIVVMDEDGDERSARNGDYIVRGRFDFYIVSEDYFGELYEAVENA